MKDGSDYHAGKIQRGDAPHPRNRPGRVLSGLYWWMRSDPERDRDTDSCDDRVSIPSNSAVLVPVSRHVNPRKMAHPYVKCAPTEIRNPPRYELGVSFCRFPLNSTPKVPFPDLIRRCWNECGRTCNVPPGAVGVRSRGMAKEYVERRERTHTTPTHFRAFGKVGNIVLVCSWFCRASMWGRRSTNCC
jgi:hypothetical protein